MSDIVWIFFRIYLIIHLMEYFNASSPSQFTNLYVNMGDDLILPCTVNNYTTAYWQGPCFRTADCTILNIATYFDGLMRYQEVPTSITVAINRSERGNIYDLHISNVSMKSAGQFVCNEFKGIGLKETKFNVILKVKPTNLCIKNTLDGRITGTAGTPLNLLCRVTSGVPLENMTWYKDQTVVHEGGPGVIKYLFTPSPENNGQKFSCVVQSDALETAMKETIILDINYRPVVQCFEESISVMEGNRFTVQCSVDSNPPPTKITIHRNNVILHRCTQPPCNLTLLGSRHDSGVYICTAQNQIGDGNNCQTVVKILYPPVVSVLILNVTTLRCTGTGEPNNVSYLSWTHYSEKGKVTNFNGSKYLELCSSCKRYMVNGLYRCSATNGIQHTDGSNISHGEFSVQLKGIPEILPKTKKVQHGKYKKSVSIEIFVYSTTVITLEGILRNGDVIESSRRIAANGTFKNEYKATYEISVLQEMDIALYTFKVRNDQGAIQFTVSLVAKADDTCKGKNGYSITHVIGISVGSSVFGAMVSLCIYRCCKKVRTRSNVIIAQRNINAEIEVQYDEIDGGHLQDIPANLLRRDATRSTDSDIGTETENENPNVTNENNVVEEDEYGLETLITDDNSNSDKSSDVPRNSYINVPQSEGNQYQSLVDFETGNIEGNNYDPLNASTRLETHYYNLRI